MTNGGVDSDNFLGISTWIIDYSSQIYSHSMNSSAAEIHAIIQVFFVKFTRQSVQSALRHIDQLYVLKGVHD